MSTESFDRRRFHELSAAALSGLTLGGLTGCGSDTTSKTAANAGEKHLCRALNECKAQGKSGKNECRGQGDCATFTHHTCAGHNDCKGQGGCGESAGINECSTKGGCAVPLMDSAWNKVRERLESKWNKEKVMFSTPPKKA
jgi:hypothetical protein